MDDEEKNEEEEMLKQGANVLKKGTKKATSAAGKNIKKALKRFGITILLILLPVIIIIILLGAVYLTVLEPESVKEGNEKSEAYTSSVTVKSGSNGTTVSIDKEKIASSRLKELEFSDEEISEMTEEEILKKIGLSGTSLDSYTAAEMLWEMSDVYSKYLKSAEDLETLLNAEIITQYPYFENDDYDGINGIIKFERQTEEGQEAISLSYVDEDTYNSWISSYSSSGDADAKNNLLSHFTISESDVGIINVAIFKEVNVKVTTNDDELTLEKAQEYFGDDEITLSETTSSGTYECTTYEVTIVPINYLNMVEKYTMPFEFLWTLNVIANDDGKLALELAQLCYDSEMVITIYDNITTSYEEDEYTYTREEKEEGTYIVGTYPDVGLEYEPNYDIEEYSDKGEYYVNYEKITKNNTETDGLTTAHTWIVDFEAEYNCTSSAAERPEEGEQIEIDETTDFREIRTDYYEYDIASGTAEGNEELLEETGVGLHYVNSIYKNLVTQEELKNNVIARAYFVDLSSYINNITDVSDDIKENVLQENVPILLRYVDSYSQLCSMDSSDIRDIDGMEDFASSEYYYLIRDYAKNYINDKILTTIAVTSVDVTYYEHEKDIKQLHYEYSSKVNYSKGTTTTEDNDNFVTVFNSCSGARSNILEGTDRLFSYLEDEEETANMVDLMKYLLNEATDSTNYGTDLDFDTVWNTFYRGYSSIVGRISGIDGDVGTIYNYFLGLGYSPMGIAGILGNMQQESGCTSNNLQNTYNEKYDLSDEEYTELVNNGTISKEEFVGATEISLYGTGEVVLANKIGYGIVQFTYSPYKQALYESTVEEGYSIDDLSKQLELLEQEIESKPSLYESLYNATSVEQATSDFFNDYEGAGDSTLPIRITYALEFYEQYQQNSYSTSSSSSSIIASGTFSSSNSEIQQILDEIVKYSGYSYVLGTKGPNTFDCSGLIYYVFGQFGIEVPLSTAYYDSSSSQCRELSEISASDLKPGDVLHWYGYETGTTSGHVAMYLGINQETGKYATIEAANPDLGVIIMEYDSLTGITDRDFKRVFRFIGDW